MTPKCRCGRFKVRVGPMDYRCEVCDEPPSIFDRYTPEQWADLPASYRRLLCWMQIASNTHAEGQS